MLSTDAFVDTADTLVAQPVVQAEIAAVLVDAIAPDDRIPAPVGVLLERIAVAVVASDVFTTFWSDAVRLAHAPLVEQLTSDVPLSEVTAHRIDLRPLVARLLDDVRAQSPAAALLLPAETPEASFQVLDDTNLGTARTLARALRTLSWLLPLAAVLALVGTFAASRTARRPLLAPGLAVVAASALVFLSTIVAPSIAASFAPVDQRDATSTVTSHVVGPLATDSIVLGLLGVAVVAAVVVRARRRDQASGST